MELQMKIEMLKKIRRARNYCLEVMERRKYDEIYFKAVELEKKLASQFGEILDSININEPLDLS
ncbi:hypothetical protein [Robertmurraya massiliosenegalensis]|uniref:hypothetical protein n=1 Tax=Robertmurraya massiliosenegalensis TaxID=1287657 RepID=UPI0002D5535C|nr:hypothetical protein [Robertmurraya massiliosenegalensis]